MKTIFLIRHAKSSWENQQIKDHERSLNQRGLKDAPAMGEKLEALYPSPGKIICSTARRARETAKMIKEHWFPFGNIEYTKQLYEASSAEVFNIIKSIQAKINSVALFFHNPTITHLANILGSTSIINVPTCGVVILTSEKDDWQSIEVASCKLVNFEYPKKVNDD